MRWALHYMIPTSMSEECNSPVNFIQSFNIKYNNMKCTCCISFFISEYIFILFSLLVYTRGPQVSTFWSLRLTIDRILSKNLHSFWAYKKLMKTHLIENNHSKRKFSFLFWANILTTKMIPQRLYVFHLYLFLSMTYDEFSVSYCF